MYHRSNGHQLRETLCSLKIAFGIPTVLSFSLCEFISTHLLNWPAVTGSIKIIDYTPPPCFQGYIGKNSSENVSSGVNTKKQRQVEQRDPDHEKVCLHRIILLYIIERHTHLNSVTSTFSLIHWHIGIGLLVSSTMFFLSLSYSGWIISM